MKRTIFFFAFFAVAMAFTAWQNSATITGKWKFDHLSVKDGVTLGASQKKEVAQEEASLKDDKVVIEFLANNVFKNTEGGLTLTGTYRFGNDGQKLVMVTDEGQQAAKVLVLSETDLAIAFDDPEMNMLVFHFKREQ